MRERDSERAFERERASEQAIEGERERTRERVCVCERKQVCYPRPISGTAQPRAQEHRCRAGAVCSAVVANTRFLKCVLLSALPCFWSVTPRRPTRIPPAQQQHAPRRPPPCHGSTMRFLRFFNLYKVRKQFGNSWPLSQPLKLAAEPQVQVGDASLALEVTLIVNGKLSELR